MNRETLEKEHGAYRDALAQMLSDTRDISRERLLEICDAEREDRLVVLPAKVGDVLNCGEVVGIEYGIGENDYEETETGLMFIPAKLIFVEKDGKTTAITFDAAAEEAKESGE